jgi:dihydroneopterin aldolase
LIETLATDIADTLIDEFHAGTVSVEVKKFVIPEAAYVSVRLTRSPRR